MIREVRTRVGILEVDLALNGGTDCHDIHHLSIVSRPCKGQQEHSRAPSDERPDWRLSAAAPLQETHLLSETQPSRTTEQLPKRYMST